MRPLPRLKEIRERASFTQQELAKRSGVGRATIASLEVGHRRAQPKTVRRLAEALGVHPAELYGRARPLEIPGAGPFTTIYERTHDGWWVVSVPEIPGAHSQGRTREEAREMIQDAVRLLLEVRREDAEKELEGREVIREPLAL
jgi:predicted RNase H-like HicB family nuclease